MVLTTVFSLNLPIPAHADYRETYSQALNKYAAGEIRDAQVSLEQLVLEQLPFNDSNVADIVSILDSLLQIYINTGNTLLLRDFVAFVEKNDMLMNDLFARELGAKAMIYFNYFLAGTQESQPLLENLLNRWPFFPVLNQSHHYRELTFLYAAFLRTQALSTDADLVAHRAVVQAAVQRNIHPYNAFTTLLRLAHHLLVTGRLDRGSAIVDFLVLSAPKILSKNTPEYFYFLTVSLVRDSVTRNFSNYEDTVKELRRLLTNFEDQGITLRLDWLGSAFGAWAILAAEDNNQQSFLEARNYDQKTFGVSTPSDRLEDNFLKTRAAYVGAGKHLPFPKIEELEKIGDSSFNDELLELARSNHLRATGNLAEAYREGERSFVTVLNKISGKRLPNLWTVQPYQYAAIITENLIELALQSTIDKKFPDDFNSDALVRAVSVLLRLRSPSGSYFSGARKEISSEMLQSTARNRELYARQYEEYVSSAMARLGPVVTFRHLWTETPWTDKTHQRESKEFNSFLELSKKLYEVDNVLWQQAPEYFTQSRLSTASHAAVELIADKDNAVIWLTFLQDKLLTLCFDGSDYHLSHSDITRFEIEKKIRGMRETLTTYKTLGSDASIGILRGFSITEPTRFSDSSFSATALSLYDNVFGEMQRCIGKKKKLYFRADPIFYSLPLNTLLIRSEEDSETNWFFQKYAYEFLSSVKSSSQYLATRKRERKEYSLLGFGDFIPHSTDSVSTTVDDKGSYFGVFSTLGQDRDIKINSLAPLPDTRDEIEKLAKAFGTDRSALYFDHDATERKFRQSRPEKYSTLVFATHGLVAGDYGALYEPALVLTQGVGREQYDNGLLTASEIRSIELDADLVILSACNTALADGTPNAQGLGSLADSFLFSGSEAVIASQWPVETSVAPLITTSIANNLTRGVGIGESLQQAITSIVNDPALKHFHHPSYWAPFIPISQGPPNENTISAPIENRLTKNWENLDEKAYHAEAWAIAKNFDSTEYAVGSFQTNSEKDYVAEGRVETFKTDGTLHHSLDFPEFAGVTDLLYTPENDILAVFGIPTKSLPKEYTSGFAVVTKINRNGKVIWKRRFVTDLHDTPYKIVALDSGLYGILVVSEDVTEGEVEVRANIWLWVIDQNGYTRSKKHLAVTDWTPSFVTAILSSNRSLVIAYPEISTPHFGTPNAITGAVSVTLGYQTNILAVDTNNENYPTVLKAQFPDGTIHDLVETRDEIIALAQIYPRQQAIGHSDVGIYGIDPTTLSIKKKFSFGGADTDWPKNLILLNNNKYVIVGYFLNRTLLESERHYQIVVTEVLPESPASEAGFQIDDIIISINGEKLIDGTHLTELIQRHPGEKIEIKLVREEMPKILSLIPKETTLEGENFFIIGVRYDLELTDPPGVDSDYVFRSITGQLFEPDRTLSSFIAVFDRNGEFIDDVVDVSPTDTAYTGALQLGSNQVIVVGRGGNQGRLIAQYTLH